MLATNHMELLSTYLIWDVYKGKIYTGFQRQLRKKEECEIKYLNPC